MDQLRIGRAQTALPQLTGGTSVRRRGTARRVVGFLCVMAALIALALLTVRIQSGVHEVTSGQMTVAQMLGSLGHWFRGEMVSEDRGQTNVEKVPELPRGEQEVEEVQGGATVDPYAFDASTLDGEVRGIRPVDLWTEQYDQTGAQSTAWQAMANDAADGPQVLILHAHTGEGYVAAGTAWVDRVQSVGRTDDGQEGVVRVGEALTQALEENGVRVLHLTVAFDSSGNAGAFSRAAEQVSAYLLQYPSIRYVIDLHRGALSDEQGHLLRGVIWHKEQPMAQIRLMAWGESLSLASLCAQKLNQQIPHLCHSAERVEVGEDWYWSGICALRVEIGMLGNDADEAKKSAQALAEALAACIGEKG